MHWRRRHFQSSARERWHTRGQRTCLQDDISVFGGAWQCIHRWQAGHCHMVLALLTAFHCQDAAPCLERELLCLEALPCAHNIIQLHCQPGKTSYRVIQWRTCTEECERAMWRWAVHTDCHGCASPSSSAAADATVAWPHRSTSTVGVNHLRLKRLQRCCTCHSIAYDASQCQIAHLLTI